MQLINSQGQRYDVVVRPGPNVWSVPPPYTVEGFLASFTPEQRRRLLSALGADPSVSGVDPAIFRMTPTDAIVLRFLARLATMRAIAFQPPGAAQARRAPTGGASGASAQSKPAEPTPPPTTREEVVCELVGATAECSHNGRKANRSGLLEVVPGRSDDRIKLAAELRGGCGKHARWEIRVAEGANEVKTGLNTSFVARNWAVKSLWGIFEVAPRPYYATAIACSGAMRRFEVKAYPIDQWKVTIEVDFKKNPLQWVWDITLTTFEDIGADDEGLKVKNELFKTLADKKAQLSYALDKVLAPLIGPSDKWEFFKTKLIFQGKWAEHTDHRAFYKYEATLKLDPMIKGEFMIPISPTNAIPPFIKRWVTDYIGDFYLYIKFQGELTLQGKWGRSGPDTHDAVVDGEGKIGVKVGGNLFLMKKGALNLDVNGGTYISLTAKAPVARKPAVEFDLKWGGIEIELTIEAAWGMVEYKRKWRPVNGGSFFDAPKLWHPLGKAA